MKSKDILNRIEDIIDNRIREFDDHSSENEEDTKNKTDKNSFKEILYLLLQIVLNLLKTPFKIIALYVKNEIIDTVKKDAKIYALLMAIMVILFVFFSVIWLFISVAIGVYFYEQGYTIFTSIIYSIGFQILSFILIALVGLFSSKRLKSFTMMKKLTKSN
jgi:membrane-associated HD superfamily phosphohydrolase